MVRFCVGGSGCESPQADLAKLPPEIGQFGKAAKRRSAARVWSPERFRGDAVQRRPNAAS